METNLSVMYLFWKKVINLGDYKELDLNDIRRGFLIVKGIKNEYRGRVAHH